MLLFVRPPPAGKQSQWRDLWDDGYKTHRWHDCCCMKRAVASLSFFLTLMRFLFCFFLSCLFFLSLIFRNIFDSFSLSFIYFIVILAVYSDNVCDFFLSSSPFFSSYSSSNCLSFYSYSGFLFPSLYPPSLSPSLSLLSPSSALTSFGFLSPSFSSTSSFSKSSPLCPFSLASSPPPLHLHKFSSTKTPPFSPLK